MFSAKFCDVILIVWVTVFFSSHVNVSKVCGLTANVGGLFLSAAMPSIAIVVDASGKEGQSTMIVAL